MPVSEEMTEIEETLEETLDVARKRSAKKKAKSRLPVYRKALKEVQQLAGNAPMRELADWIRKQIREKENPPSSRAVRKQGATICRNHGREVSTGSWLGA